MKVLVGMSGGIDSSVAAYLLKKEGYDVAGITMLIWRADSPYPVPASPGSCYNPDKSKDLENIKKVSEIIGIEHHIVDCSALFESAVLDNFRSEYMSGHTPNPCIWCNQKVKFGAMVEYAHTILDFDYFATGHYAKVERLATGRYALRKARDEKKDQSYFLSRLSQSQLSAVIFPLGDYLKTEVREIDEAMGFHEKGERESQDFYGGDYTDLLSAEDKDGEIVTEDGRVIGHHKGFWHYTIGQRKGLGIAYSEALYVIALDPENNRVIVGTEPSTHNRVIEACDVVYGAAEGFDAEKMYSVKIRSMATAASANVEKTANGFKVRFLDYVRGAAPGQSAVVYDSVMVVASGIIT